MSGRRATRCRNGTSGVFASVIGRLGRLRELPGSAFLGTVAGRVILSDALLNIIGKVGPVASLADRTRSEGWQR